MKFENPIIKFENPSKNVKDTEITDTDHLTNLRNSISFLLDSVGTFKTHPKWTAREDSEFTSAYPYAFQLLLFTGLSAFESVGKQTKQTSKLNFFEDFFKSSNPKIASSARLKSSGPQNPNSDRLERVKSGFIKEFRKSKISFDTVELDKVFGDLLALKLIRNHLIHANEEKTEKKTVDRMIGHVSTTVFKIKMDYYGNEQWRTTCFTFSKLTLYLLKIIEQILFLEISEKQTDSEDFVGFKKRVQYSIKNFRPLSFENSDSLSEFDLQVSEALSFQEVPNLLDNLPLKFKDDLFDLLDFFHSTDEYVKLRSIYKKLADIHYQFDSLHLDDVDMSLHLTKYFLYREDFPSIVNRQLWLIGDAIGNLLGKTRPKLPDKAECEKLFPLFDVTKKLWQQTLEDIFGFSNKYYETSQQNLIVLQRVKEISEPFPDEPHTRWVTTVRDKIPDLSEQEIIDAFTNAKKSSLYQFDYFKDIFHQFAFMIDPERPERYALYFEQARLLRLLKRVLFHTNEWMSISEGDEDMLKDFASIKK